MKYAIRRATDNDLTAIELLFHNTIGEVNIGDYNTSQINAWQGAGSVKRWGELWINAKSQWSTTIFFIFAP